MTGFRLNTNKKESENKTIRFPLPLIERIEEKLINNDISFSSFVIQACEYALDNMEDDNKEKSNNNQKYRIKICYIYLSH